MSGKIYAMPHEVTYYEADYAGEMTLTAMILVMILASGKQGVELGVGDDVVHELGLGWIITQYECQITRMPRAGEEVIFKTQATFYNRFFCYRDFFVEDQAGNTLVKLTAIFVLLSYENRKMTSLVPAVVAPYEGEETKRLVRLNKPERVDEAVATNKPYHVRYFDIDDNHHVNNAIYFDWMLDSLAFDFLSEHRLSGFAIKYEHEVAYGQTVDSLVQVCTSTDNLTTRHQIKVDDQICSEAEFSWQPKKV